MSDISKNDLLLFKYYVVQNALSYNGKAQFSSVLGKIISENPKFKEQIKSLSQVIHKIIDEINNLNVEEQSALLNNLDYKPVKNTVEKETKHAFPDLDNASKGKVVTRFPPEPNGYLHIGHAKAVIINETYARRYNGKFILRFDDTNPVQEKIEYYDAIKEGLDWLSIKPDRIKNTSDDMELLYKYAKKLIVKGFAYVCKCEISTMRSNRSKGKPCDCRLKNDEQYQIEEWEKMENQYKPNESILRFKGNMSDDNKVMRDPTLFRIIEATHPLTGDRYRVWPTYDFSVSIEDSTDGITHAMRTKEYELRQILYFEILKILELRQPNMIEFSRLELLDTPVSKRKLLQLIDQNQVEGWNDPRLPTLLGLKRKGINPQAIKEFIFSMGVTKTESKPTWDILESFNRKIIDPISKRYFSVFNPIELIVTNDPKKSVNIQNHPKRNLGSRTIHTNGKYWISKDDLKYIQPNNLLRLLNLYNIKILEVNNNQIISVFHSDEIINKLPKIQWVTNDYAEFNILIPHSLFKNGVYNKSSLETIPCFIEKDVEKLNQNEIIQLVRFGFCRIDCDNNIIYIHK